MNGYSQALIRIAYAVGTQPLLHHHYFMSNISLSNSFASDFRLTLPCFLNSACATQLHSHTQITPGWTLFCSLFSEK